MRSVFLGSWAAMAIVVGVIAGFSAADDASAANHTVSIAGFAFNPATINVAVGDTVTWTNNDTVPHTATSAAGVSPAFDTGNINAGASGSLTFNTAGSFSYFCKIHPNMTGTIVVSAAAASPTATATTSGGGGATATASPAAPRTGSGTYGPTSNTTWYVAGGGLLLVAVAAGGVVALRRR